MAADTQKILWMGDTGCGIQITTDVYHLSAGKLYVQKAIENGHRNSEFSHNSMVIFHSYVAVYQRVSTGNLDFATAHPQ